KLLRLRRSSDKRVPLPGPPCPLRGPRRPCIFSPTRESLSHLFAVLRRGQPMPSGAEVLGNGTIRRQKSSLNLSQFVARKHWRRRWVSPRRFSANLLEIGGSQRWLRASMPPNVDLLQTARN